MKEKKRVVTENEAETINEVRGVQENEHPGHHASSILSTKHC